MSRTALQLEHIRNEDRFYMPVKSRNSQKQQKKQGVTDHSRETDRSASSTKSNILASEISNSEELQNSTDKPDFVSSAAPCTNLDRFLESTTPSVPVQYLSKTTIKGWKTCDVEFQPFFTLGDLRESFKEWSAYGVGVPLVLSESDVVQYYVPYLSGIQLYSKSTSSSASSRQASDDSNGEYNRDSSSDGSIDYEIENGMKNSWDQNHHSLRGSCPLKKMASLSLRDKDNVEGFSIDDGEVDGDIRSNLLFEFLEQDPPYSREPLSHKMLDLASWFPQLNTLRSCDLLPLSWISVAWYPIYRIPTGSTLKDLDACFLTYHSLSITPRETPVAMYPNEMDSRTKISLPAFGLASYKVKGSIWIQNGEREHTLSCSLKQAAENRLRNLQVNHPDFQFFSSHGIQCR